MRTFEFLLILLALGDGATRIALADRRPIWISTIPMFAFLLGIIHIAGEGARWQMIPIYIVIVVGFSTSLIRAFRTGDILIEGGALSRGAGVLVILLSVISIAAATAFPMFELPPPTGDFTVGVRDVALSDSGPIVRVYFPSDNPAGNRTTYGLTDLPTHTTYLTTRYGIPDAFLGHLASIHTSAFPESELSGELPRYRVLVAYPESDRPSTRTTALAENLASHGFIVFTSPAAVDTLLGLEEVAEHLESIDPSGPAGWLADHLDLGRIGVYGFGDAAGAVIEACSGGTFRAGAAIGPAGHSGNPVVPFLYLHPEETPDTPLTDVHETTYIVSIRGARLDNFGDDAFISPLMPTLGDFGSIDPDRVGRITHAYLSAFFNKHLTRGTVEPVLDGPSAAYPEVSIRIHDAEE